MGRFKVDLGQKACHGFLARVELCLQFLQLSDICEKSREDEGVAKTSELDELGCVREVAEACLFNVINMVNLEAEEKVILAFGGQRDCK